MTEKELEQIYNEGYKPVFWTAMALLKNEADAEDVVQDTFIAFMESYSDIKDTSKAVPLLKKIAANKSLNRIKLARTDNEDDEFFESCEAVPEDFLPDSIVESDEMRRIVMDIIEKTLSDDIRRTLILFYFDEMSTKEIAEAMGIPQGTVLWRLGFARKKIKKEVEKYEKETDTKLYSVALPFLALLFQKEAEMTPLRPMPASLAELSASKEAARANAGQSIVSETIRKGTGIAMKKLIILCGHRRLSMSGLKEWLMEDVGGSKKQDSQPAGRRNRSFDPDSRAHKICVNTAYAAISIIMLVATWYVVSWYVNKTVIPTPLETWDALVDFFENGDSTAGGSAWSYIRSSFGTLLKGFLIALVLAFPIGLLLGSVPVLDRLFSPALNVLRPIAPVAWAPVLIILLQSDASGAMMVVFIGAFFPILTTVSFGVKKIDANLINATKVLGATWSQTFFKITVPASVPFLMNGVKTALGIGWMCIVSAELYASGVGGLGNYITNQAGLGAWPQVYAGIVIVGILGLITVLVADYVSKVLNKKWGVEE